MAETRRVIAYGRKKQNFVTVKSSSFLASPTSTPPRQKQEVIEVNDDSLYPPLKFVPEPNKLGKSSLKGAMEAARKQQANRENAIHKGHTRHAPKQTSMKPAASDAIQAKQCSPGRPTKAALRRSRGAVMHPTKSPKAVHYPLGVKAATQQTKASVVKTVEIITLDSDVSEVRREQRNLPPSIIDLCSLSGSSRASLEARKTKANLTAGRNRAKQKKKIPTNRVVSDESESETEEDPIKTAPPQRKLVVVSDNDNEDEDEDEDEACALQPVIPTGDGLSDTGTSSTQRLEDITTSMGKLVLAKDGRSSQRSKPPPKEQKKRPISPSLKSLLETCDQLEVMDFETFISDFPRDQIPGQHAGQVSFRKLGEASYSEVFAIGEVVIKVVPLLSVDKNSNPGPQTRPMPDMPSSSSASDVNQEIIITREIGELQSRFMKLLR
ncbi:hypothetical protein FRC05_002622 [Tulasnella sp. 425]|nr:hypothetical protein FRC05_002622 [Tulasnella sp. 425]